MDYGLADRAGRRVTLRPVDEQNWRAVADVAPLDGQRRWVAPLAARYLLLSLREQVWTSLAVYADDVVVGHIMWGRDEDGSYWVGGMLVDGREQGAGVGRAAVQTMTAWLATLPDCTAIRLSYQPDNVAAKQLYESVGFVATGEMDDDEVIAELTAGASNPEGRSRGA